MISVAVKVETACGACRMPMPVNTLAREARCPSCGRSTAFGMDLWQALLRDPLYEGPRMLQNEARRRWTSNLSAAYTRRAPCCQGCEKEIPIESIHEVREQAMLRCERCAQPTWVRAVPAELAGALPNITHLVGEDPDPAVVVAGDAADAATFPCPQCGSPVPFDGVNRAFSCRFCSASVHVPDDFVYRGRRKVAANWFLCFHPSTVDGAPAAQAVAAGLFDWDEPPLAAVDVEGNLYCAARQVHHVLAGDDVRTQTDDVLWSIDPSLTIRWLQRNRLKAVRLVLSPQRTLLVTGWGWPSRPWLHSSTGHLVGGMREIDIDLLDCKDMACDRDGSLLILKGGRLRRITPEGVELPVWPGDAPGRSTDVRNPCELPDRPLNTCPEGVRVYCGPDGVIYLMDSNEIARFDASGRRVYGVKLPGDVDTRCPPLGADLHGNVYVVCRRQLVRIDARGRQEVILESKRDRLPQSPMSIAVYLDGSFWLFGTNGRAWKFDQGGTLVFASEKEPRPRKPTRDELNQQQILASMAELKAREDEVQREYQAQLEANEASVRWFNVLFAVLIAVLAIVIMFGLWSG